VESLGLSRPVRFSSESLRASASAPRLCVKIPALRPSGSRLHAGQSRLTAPDDPNAAPGRQPCSRRTRADGDPDLGNFAQRTQRAQRGDACKQGLRRDFFRVLEGPSPGAARERGGNVSARYLFFLPAELGCCAAGRPSAAVVPGWCATSHSARPLGAASVLDGDSRVDPVSKLAAEPSALGSNRC
jgi:hypothetical protein